MASEIERLEQDLMLLGRALAYPPTPSLVHAVRQRLAEARPPQPARPWQLALAGLAVAAVLLAFVVSVAPPARDAVADFFDRINIFQAESVPENLPREITGTQLTLDQAQQRLGAPIRLPPYPERLDPKRVLFQDFGEVKTAVVFFSHPDGSPFALFQTRGSRNKGVPVVGKGVPRPEEQVTFVAALGDESAFWLVGLRIVQYYDTSGNVIPESVRATDVNTLVWDKDGFIFRLEGNLSQAEAVLIAKSLR